MEFLINRQGCLSKGNTGCRYKIWLLIYSFLFLLLLMRLLFPPSPSPSPSCSLPSCFCDLQQFVSHFWYFLEFLRLSKFWEKDPFQRHFLRLLLLNSDFIHILYIVNMNGHEFRFFLSCDINLPVTLRIETLEGQIPPSSSSPGRHYDDTLLS